MKYAQIFYADVGNGPGARISLFVSGCTHHCNGCFNEIAWDFNYGEEFTDSVQESLLGELRPNYISGLTLLGGEPMEPQNQRALLPFLRRVKQEMPNKTIWLYSGYTFEELTGKSRARCEVTDEILALCDVLVDGEFVQEKKNIRLKFRGSENQRTLNLPESLKIGSPVWIPGYQLK